MWITNVIFLDIGLVMMSRMSHTGGSTRGGGGFEGLRGLLGRSAAS
jgi:hypothetical protein